MRRLEKSPVRIPAVTDRLVLGSCDRKRELVELDELSTAKGTFRDLSLERAGVISCF